MFFLFYLFIYLFRLLSIKEIYLTTKLSCNLNFYFLFVSFPGSYLVNWSPNLQTAVSDLVSLFGFLSYQSFMALCYKLTI